MSRGGPVQVRRLSTPDSFRAHLDDLGVSLPLSDRVAPAPAGPFAQPFTVEDGSAGRLVVGNRFCVLPMEGWDGTPDGRPTELVERRWRRFGAGGAKLIWGGEAVAVRHDGRANPRQLVIGPDTVADLAALREALVDSHVEATGGSDGLVVGLQLTHSGRFSRPDGPFRPMVAYRHPVLDRRGPEPTVLSDEELDSVAAAFVDAAGLAAEAGFDFVDVKACHGYLGHELLSGFGRPGRYGGDLEGRTRFIRHVVAGIRDSVPALAVGVRLSVFDVVPHRAGGGGLGEPEPLPGGAAGHGPVAGPRSAYPYAFGGDGTGLGVDLSEPHELLRMLEDLGVGMVCVTAGSPYYCPHVQRPAFFPPSDGYAPPADPLVDVARLVGVTAQVAREHPRLAVVGSGYSYLQEWLAHVAEAVVEQRWATAVGLGRMVLSYPHLPADVLAGRPLDRRLICRTFSDCTTAPRNGLVSGCFPLDDFYGAMPERSELARVKKLARASNAAPVRRPATAAEET